MGGLAVDAGHEQLDAMGIAWRLGATLFFVVLNGFFVAAEFALVKLRAAQVDALVSQGRRSARTVRHILRHLDRYLSSCQLGITLASLILGALGEPAVSVLILALLRGFGVDAAGAVWVPWLSIGLAFTVITMLHMTIGEQAPKMWALRRSEGTSLWTAPILWGFTWLFGPFISAINGISNALLRLAGLPAGGGHEEIHSAEEIRSILSLSASAGHISDREYELTENIFRMIQLEVRHIVVPRVEVEFLSLDRPLDDNLRRIAGSGHTRLPLCEVGLDTVVGFVHAKDVLEKSVRNEEIDLKSLARAAMFVPDTMPLSRFLAQLQAGQEQCAAVVDERGTVIGFAFREDALEEIVGPLGDEFDQVNSEFREVEPGVFEAAGRVALPEICDRLDIELAKDEREDEDTIGGHVTARLGHIPRGGEVVRLGRYQVTVLEPGRRRVQRVRIERARETVEGETGETDATEAAAEPEEPAAR